MLRIILLIVLLHVPVLVCADRFDDLFAVVFIDADSERRFGPVPFERRLLARGIERLADAGASGVILKFFLDMEKDRDQDGRLAQSLAAIPVVLQARIDHQARNSHPLDKRFLSPARATTTIRGRAGWIPAPRFAARAVDVGFADFDGLPMSLFVDYQDHTARSLALVALERALGREARLDDGKVIRFGNLVLPVDRFNRAAVKLDAQVEEPYIPFHDVVDGKNLDKLHGRFVILGYHGSRMHTVPTCQGEFPAHVLFVKILRQLLNMLELADSGN